MIYFYAGLGAAMLTGIMVLFEVGLALTGQSLVDEQTEFEVYQDIVNSSDRLFQRMLTEPQDLQAIGTGHYGSVLCKQIMCRIKSPGIGCRSGNTNNPLYAGLERYSTPRYTPSTGVWSSSCVLERELDNREWTHRLLIRPNRDRLDLGYELYSCIVERNISDPRCLFERGA